MNRPVLLAVDDTPGNLTVFQQLLEEYLPECEVLTANSGEQGLAVASERQLDGVLVDFEMPGMTGLEMCQRLKEDEETAQVPVILITAHESTPQLRAEALAAGADDFLTKLISGLELAARVKVILRVKRAEDELRSANARLSELVDQRTQELRQKEEFSSTLFEHSPIPTIVVDREGKVVRFNRAGGEEPDRPPKIGDIMYEDYAGKHEIDMRTELMECIRSCEPKTFPERKYGDRFLFIDIAPFAQGAVIACQDITERKRAEDALRASHAFLETTNRHTEMSSLLEEAVVEVRNLTGCRAAGIRILDEQGSTPYEAYAGFSQTFYELESALSIRSDECMCINVIKGDTDPGLPFYTEGGSFYMNGTTRFLATVSEEEKGRTRNVCNQVGYESVALIPIRYGNVIEGLIHVADPREGRVPIEMVELLENIAVQLGTAVRRTRVEEALRESEERFRQLAETTPDAVVVGQDGRNVYANSAAARLLRAAGPEELVGLDVFAIIDPAQHGSARQQMQRALAGEEQPPFEDRFVRLDGALVPVEIAVSVLSWQSRPALQIVARDITERKAAEETLARSERQLREAQQIAQFGSWGRNLRTGEYQWSDEQYRIFGYEPGGVDPTFEFFRSRVHPEDVAVIDEAWEKLLSGESPLEYEFRFIGKDGALRFGQTRAVAEQDDSGNVVRVNGTLQDITERRRVEVELALERGHLRRVFAQLIDAQETERKRISQELHDEMGQALTAMHINLVEIGKDLPPECRSETRERLAETISFVEETLEQIRELAHGLRPGMLDDLGLVPTVRWYVSQFRKRLGITVDYEAIGLEERPTSDTEVVLYRAVQEALTNVARHAKANRVKIRLERKESAVVALIEDDGTGFDAAQLDGPGALERGVGLTGMRERTRSIGGTVTIESRPGHGTRLLIEIPVSEQ